MIHVQTVYIQKCWPLGGVFCSSSQNFYRFIFSFWRHFRVSSPKCYFWWPRISANHRSEMYGGGHHCPITSVGKFEKLKIDEILKFSIFKEMEHQIDSPCFPTEWKIKYRNKGKFLIKSHNEFRSKNLRKSKIFESLKAVWQFETFWISTNLIKLRKIF